LSRCLTKPPKSFWDNAGLQASIVANWKLVAARYKGNATVAGYDLINEPITRLPGIRAGKRSGWTWLLSGSVRSVPSTPTIRSSLSLLRVRCDGFSAMTRPLAFDNIVYSAICTSPRNYAPGLYSYTNRISYPSSAGSPIGTINKATLSSTLDPMRRFVAQYRVPIYIGEFSCARWALITLLSSTWPTRFRS